MHWILLAIIAILLIAMAGRYPRVAFSSLGILLVCAAGLYHLSNEGEGSLEELKIADVSIRDIKLNPYYADGFRINGTILNQSKSHDVSEIDLQFSVLDCIQSDTEDKESECTNVTDLTRKVRLHVPFEDKRSFETTIQPGELRIKGERRWKFKIIGVTGRAPLR